MSTKQSSILNNWLKICSIAFGVTCGCTLPFTQNLATSALMGLATMPGVGASIVVRSRQRQHQLNRQLARGRLRLNELQQNRKLLIEELHVRQNECQSIDSRVSQLHSLAANLTDRINSDRDRHQQLEQKLTETRSQLSATELELNNKQTQLDDLVTATITKENEIQIRARELKIAQLELNSRKAELDHLELQIQSKSPEISNLDLNSFEPQPPTISRSIDEIVGAEQWYNKFIDNPHLSILQHIEKHGTITEIEASSKLGNARSVRQFANKIEEYIQALPFSIRVESSPTGNRYLKEDRN